MLMMKKGDCEHCGRLYRYSLWHCGFGDNSYAYCEDCGMLATISYSNPEVAGFPPLSAQCSVIDESWEPLLQPCACGGRFRKGASPRCPFCYEKLSPVHAATHMEKQAASGHRGWEWQMNWSGIYCLAIEDPHDPGTLRQMADPLLKPEVTKEKSRWSLFSFGR